jgi:peptidyl-tRNA hydrolase
MEHKQTIVLRKDLNVRKGKMVAQGAHASMRIAWTSSRERYPSYRRGAAIRFGATSSAAQAKASPNRSSIAFQERLSASAL